MPDRSVIITGDLLRYKETIPYFADPIINKSYYFFRGAIAEATGNQPEPVYARDTARFDRKKFYRLCGFSRVNAGNWMQIVNGAYTDVALAYFADAFRNCLLVIQEAGPLRQLLDRADIPYVEHALSSIRFTEDQHYAFRTNRPAIREKLLRYRLGEDRIYADADRVRLYYACKEPAQEDALHIPDNTLLCCGQKAGDLSLVRDGRAVSFLDYREEMDTLFRSYDHVLYKRHPYQTFHGDRAESFIHDHANLAQTTVNFYRLMSHTGITGVAALSSGTLNEAPYFDKRVHTISHTFTPHYKGNEAPAPEDWITLDNGYFTPGFWADILEGEVPVRSGACTGFENSIRLRTTLGRNWDYEIGREASIAIANIQKSSKAIQARLDTVSVLCYRLGMPFYTRRKAGMSALTQRWGICAELSQLRRHMILLVKPLLPALSHFLPRLFPPESRIHQYVALHILGLLVQNTGTSDRREKA